MATLTFDDLPEAPAAVAFDDLPDVAANDAAPAEVSFDDLPSVAPASRFGSENAPWPTESPEPSARNPGPTPQEATIVRQAQAAGTPVIMVDGKPTVGEKPYDDYSDLGQRFLGGLAKGSIDMAGGGGGLVGQYLEGSSPRDLERWDNRIAEISKKPSVRDDFTDDELRQMPKVPDGYRTPAEEAELPWLQSLTKGVRERDAGGIAAAVPFRDFQKLATLASKESETFFGQDPVRQDFFLSKLVDGAGSLPPYIASSMLGGPALSMFIGSLQTAQSERNAAIDAGHPELADEAFDKGLLIGATEGIGVGGGASAPAKSFSKKVIAAIKKGFEEGGQEWVQQTLGNLNASKFTGYDPKRPVTQGSGDAALIGFILGGGTEGVSQSGSAALPTVADPNSAEAEMIEFERKKAEAIAAADALKQQAAAAAQSMPAAAEEAAKLAEVIEQQAAAAQPAPKEEQATVAKEETAGDVGEVLFPSSDLSTRSGDPVKTEAVTSVRKTTNDDGQPVFQIGYQEGGKNYTGFSDNPAWELHEKFTDGAATPAPESQPAPAAESAPEQVVDSTPDPVLSRLDELEASLADEVSPPAQSASQVPAAAPTAPEGSPESAQPRAAPAGDQPGGTPQSATALPVDTARETATDAASAETTPPAQSAPATVPAESSSQASAEPTSAEGEESTSASGLRIVPQGKRFKIVNAADEQVGKRTYETQAHANQAAAKIGQRSTFRLPPSQDGNDIIDAVIEQGGINISGLSREERNNLFPHRGIWRNALTTDNAQLTPDEVARLLAPSEENAAMGIQSYGDGDQRTMFDLIDKAVQSRRRMRDQGKAQVRNQKADEKRVKAFAREVLSTKEGAPGTPVSQLKVGDELQAAGETFVVTDLDPDTDAITMEDGERFGTQIVENGQTVHGALKPVATDALADWPDLDTEEKVREYAKDEGLNDERKSPPESSSPVPDEGDADAEGKERADGAQSPVDGPRPASPKPESPLERARRVVEEIQAELADARDEGDNEHAASLGRVLGKLRKDLAALEKAESSPKAETAPAERVELWQATRDQVGTQLAKHREAVRDAVKAGKAVPDAVLAEYAGASWADKEISKRAKAAKKQGVEESQQISDSVETASNQPIQKTDENLQPSPKLADGQDQGALLTGGEVNTGKTANVTNEEGGTLVRLGGQIVAKLNQDAQGEFTPALNENGEKLTAEQKATINQAAKDYTKTWRAAEVRRLAAKPKSAADLTTQLDMLESGRSESPLFEQKPDKVEAFLDSAIDKLKSKPGELFSDPLFIQSVGKPVLRAALQVVRATYTATKNVAQAVADGMAYLRANVADLDEAKAQAFLEQAMPTTAPKPPIELPQRSGDLPSTTAAYNAETDKLLARGGFEPIEGPARKALGTSWDEAQAQVSADRSRGSRLVTELIENPRTLRDDVESGVLLHELATRKAEQVAAQEALFAAVESGDEAAVADAQARLSKARDATFEAITAAKLTGTAWGRAGRMRQVKIDQDYSLVAMEASWRAEVNGGKPLTEDQTKLIAELQKKIAESEAKIAELEAKQAAAEAQRVFDQVVKEARADASNTKKIGTRVRNFLHDQAAAAKARIIARRGKLFATVDPLNIAGLADEAIIGADKIASGLSKLADWSKSMLEDFGARLEPYLPALFDKSKALHGEVEGQMRAKVKPKKSGKADPTEPAAPATPEQVLKSVKAGEPLDPRLVFDLARAHVNAGVQGMDAVMAAVHADLLPNHPDLTVRDVRDAFSGYGKVTYPSREADLSALREYRTLARLTSQLEDAERRLAPLKTGPQRDKASQAVRDLTKRVKETMRRLGIESVSPAEQLRTSLDAVKTRLRNQIEDLEKQIATRTKPEGKTPIPYDAEATALRTERDRLAGIAEEIFGKPELTDEQRIAAATKAIDRAIAEEDALLKQGILKRPVKESKTPTTPQLESKRAMLDAMRDLRRDLADAATPKKGDEQRILESLERRRDALLEKRESGDLSTGSKKAAALTSDQADVQAQIDTLNSQIEEARNAAREAVNPPKTAEERALETALKTARKSIERYDELLKSGKLTPEERAARFTPTAELETLWNERNALRDLVSELRVAERPKQTPEEAARKAALKAADKRIAELDRRLREGDFSKPVRQPGKADQFADVTSKRAEAKALADLYRELEKAQQPKRTAEEIQLARDKKLIAKRTAELERRVKEGDYAPKPKKDPVMDAEKENLLFENAKAKEAYMRGLFDARQKARSIPKKIFGAIGEVLNTSRAVLTSFDLSGVFRQGGFIVFGHPVRAAKSIMPMLRAFASEKKSNAVNKEIKNRPNAKSGLYDQSKLFLSDQDALSLTKLEEQFMSRFIQKSEMVPGETGKNALRTAKNVTTAPIRASARAYTTFLNKLRADSFDAMANTLGGGAALTQEEGRAIAAFINVATGRGELPGKMAQTAAGLNSIFFAPRYVLSRFQLLAAPFTGFSFGGGNARTRTLIATEYARYLAGVALVYGLASLMQDDDDPAIELDPTSSDFLKIRFGDSRLDPMSGLLQSTVFAAREGDALRRFLTQDDSKEPKYGSGGDVLGRFLRSKLSPAVGTVVDALAGKDVTGHRVTPADAALRGVTPISMGDILKTMEEQGIARGTALSLLSLLGMGLQTYAERKR